MKQERENKESNMIVTVIPVGVDSGVMVIV